MKYTAPIFLFLFMFLQSCDKLKLPVPEEPKLVNTTKYVFKQPDSLGTLPILWYRMGYGKDTG